MSNNDTRVIAQHYFEGGGRVVLTCSGVSTAEALDMVEHYIRLKREELQRLKPRSADSAANTGWQETTDGR